MPERIAVRDSAGVPVVESVLDAATPTCAVAPEPTLTIGVADGPPEYQLHRTFGAARLSDGRIAIVNQGSEELRFYDAEGRFLRASGGEGVGPGEFRDAFTLAVLPGDTLWVGELRPWSWEVFAPDGRWVRSVMPTPPHINRSTTAVLDDGRMIIVPRTVGEVPLGRFAPRTMLAVLHAPHGALVDTIGIYEDGRDGRLEEAPNLVLSPLFESSARLVAGGSRVIVGHTSIPELRVHEAEDTLRLDRIIRWTAEPRPVTAADVAAEHARIAEQYADVDPGERRRFADPLTHEDRPVADNFPVYSSVVIGRDGRIWVRGYPMPGAADNDEWLIFAPDGELQCRLSAERFQQMPDFGSDYILVMKRDDLGVERIHQYALGKPTPVE